MVPTLFSQFDFVGGGLNEAKLHVSTYFGSEVNRPFCFNKFVKPILNEN